MKRRTNKKMVTVWDKSADTFQSIPKCELAPGMIRMNLEGTGEVWIRQDQLEGIQQGEYQSAPFGPEFREFFVTIKEAFDPYFFQTLEKWEDGFRRDRNPEREIAMWLVAAETMREFAPGHPTPRNLEVFQLLTNAMNNGSDGAKLTFQAEHLTNEEVNQILRIKE
jgi:hypothetical protein